jgi:hypothetical protein
VPDRPHEYDNAFGTTTSEAGCVAERTTFDLPKDISMRAVTAVLIPALLALLCGAGYYPYRGLTLPGEAMPGNGYVALALGVGFSLTVGCSLVTLVFYSSRPAMASRRVAATNAKPMEADSAAN